jgi:hypothetical protein
MGKFLEFISDMKETLNLMNSAIDKNYKSEKSLSALRATSKAKQEFTKAKNASEFMPGLAEFHRAYAEDLMNEANRLMIPEHAIVLAPGREAIPAFENRSLAGVRETLERPDTIGVEASSSRLDLLADADAVALGIDAAESINAMNSLEKMLAHQLAAAHRFSLKHLALIDRTKDNLEKLRLTNAAARMMESFQNGMKLLHRIRSGGRQVMVVQHVCQRRRQNASKSPG